MNYSNCWDKTIWDVQMLESQNERDTVLEVSHFIAWALPGWQGVIRL